VPDESRPFSLNPEEIQALEKEWAERPTNLDDLLKSFNED
jgi:hypothetical protein